MNALMSILFTLALMIAVSVESEGASPGTSGSVSVLPASQP